MATKVTQGRGPAVFPAAEPKVRSDKCIGEDQYNGRDSFRQPPFGGAKDLAQRLAQDVDNVVLALVPSAMLYGEYWIVGLPTEETGKTLYIRRTGDRAGRWSTAAAGPDDRGNMVDLIGRVRGVVRLEAMAWARAYLGGAS